MKTTFKYLKKNDLRDICFDNNLIILCVLPEFSSIFTQDG